MAKRVARPKRDKDAPVLGWDDKPIAVLEVVKEKKGKKPVVERPPMPVNEVKYTDHDKGVDAYEFAELVKCNKDTLEPEFKVWLKQLEMWTEEMAASVPHPMAQQFYDEAKAKVDLFRLIWAEKAKTEKGCDKDPA